MQIYKFKSLLSFQLDCFYNVQLIKIFKKRYLTMSIYLNNLNSIIIDC